MPTELTTACNGVFLDLSGSKALSHITAEKASDALQAFGVRIVENGGSVYAERQRVGETATIGPEQCLDIVGHQLSDPNALNEDALLANDRQFKVFDGCSPHMMKFLLRAFLDNPIAREKIENALDEPKSRALGGDIRRITIGNLESDGLASSLTGMAMTKA